MKNMILAALLLFSACGFAEGFFFDTRTGERLDQGQFFERLSPASILVFGEKHAVKEGEDLEFSIQHHRRQGDLYRAYGLFLKAKGEGLNGGMEFIAFEHQIFVDNYFYGVDRSRESLLKKIGWSSHTPFEQYERQFVFPLHFQGWTYGLNASRTLTKRVAQVGLEGLNKEEKAKLPPQFEIGNSLYSERFAQAMGGHVPAEKLANYFAAQSIWDDTMAWKALEISNRSTNRMIILVGEFHVEYGGGLPDRLLKRNPSRPVHSLIQREYLSENNFDPNQLKDIKYGPIADYVWVTFK